MNNILNPCSKCGKDWDSNWELIDTLYPSKRDPFTGEFSEWNIVCQIHNTGCGRTVYGKSKQDVIGRWNAGKTDEWMRE